MAQPPGTTGEPSDGAPTTAAIAPRSSPIAAMSPMGGCLSLIELAGGGRVGPDHVADELVPRTLDIGQKFMQCQSDP